MKKGILFLMLSVLTLGAWADTYTPVAYIEYPSNGADNNSRRFDTGYKVKQNTKIVVKFMAYSGNSWRAIFSGRDKFAGKGMSLYQSNDNQMEYFVGNWTADRNNINLSTGTENIHTAVCTYEKLILDGTETASGATSFTQSTRNVTLFSNPEIDHSFCGRIYYFSIYEDNKLVHNFVPAKSSNGTKGFYDIVGNTYITTVTSGDDANFTAGPDGNEVCAYWSTGDAILPSIKYGGSYSAYTWAKDLGHGWADADFNIIAGTPAEIDGKNWYETDYAPSSEWQLGNSVLPNSWSSNMGDIYVRRQFIIANNASLPSTVYMPAPHDDAPCEYYINGTLVWSRTGDELAIGADATEKYGKANGWYEGEVVRLTDEKKALIKTDGSVNVFAFHVHQNWGGRYADGGLYGDAGTDGTPSKQFKDNYPEIDALISLCEAENTTSDAAFQTAIDNAIAHQNMLQNTTNRFNDLVVARKRHNAEKVVEEFTGTAPADGLECYLYNVGEKKFLCGGNDWGAHASLGFAAHYVKLNGNDSDGYEIKTYLLDSGHNKSDGQYLGHGGYMDSDPGNKWKFVSQGDNKYNIVWADAESKLLGYESPTVNQISTNCKTTTSATNQWKLVTKAERDALLVNATPDNPVDATYYIDNPGFDQRWSISNWTLSEGMAVNNRDQQMSDFVVSGWNETGDGQTAEVFKIEQVITGLMPGLYEVGVQACYRHGDDSEDDGVSVAKLFANNEETIIKGVKAEIDKILEYTVLGTDEKAIEAFQIGLYKNTVRVAVGSDGRLTIGVKRDAADFRPYDWLAADNFRLTYLGPTSESVSVTNAGYATYCSENALDFTGKDIKAYVGTKTGDKLTFTPINQVPANTGLLLVYNGEKTEDVPVIASASAVENNCLVGVNVETTINSTDYILNVVNGGAGFYKAGTYTTLGAHKAYIPAAVGGNVKGFTIDFEDDATGISLMEDGRSQMEDGAIYNVAGQRLSKTQKGINIVNGKKIAVK